VGGSAENSGLNCDFIHHFQLTLMGNIIAEVQSESVNLSFVHIHFPSLLHAAHVSYVSSLNVTILLTDSVIK